MNSLDCQRFNDKEFTRFVKDLIEMNALDGQRFKK